VIAPHVEDFARESKRLTENDEPFDPQPTPGVANNELSHEVERQPIDEEHLITAINLAIDSQLVQAVGRVFQVNCTGMPPILIDLKHLPGSCTRGTALNADVVFEMSRTVFLKIISEELSPMTAYMQGSLSIKGAIQDALSLKYLAERVKQLL
ncbi:unnamed protein product, partial [Nippostrongylus brasiliensis]|uniref:Stomatin-like protein 1 (inferred by orthology to a human protein) n=1 Tax=Nippostrongylus brasiliensis TaxID=27835 RepID=A0A0N4Y7S1_NIPBR